MFIPHKGPMKRRRNYPDPGICIFCNKQPGTTDEHIIPRGIGGSLVIKNGTCIDCLKTIAPFEAKLINNDFEAARVFCEIPTTTKKIRNRLTTFKAKNAERDVLEKLYDSSDKHSGMILFNDYPIPGLEAGRSIHAPFPSEGWVIVAKCFTEKSRDVECIQRSPWDDLKFPRLLAKIAHSYWIAENGQKSISHALTKFILYEPTQTIGYFVGGYHKNGAPGDHFPGSDLHFLNHGTSMINGIKWGYVDIGLFASYGPQTNYRAYVGLVVA